MSLGISAYGTQVNSYMENVNSVSNTDTKAADKSSTSDNSSVASKTDAAAVYEKSDNSSSAKATYDIGKKSSTDRAAIVEQMKSAQDEQRQSLINMVREMIKTQGGKQKEANGFSAFGGTVTEEARRSATEAISEDGYWGVKQTSQRLFDFASAIAGDDVEKMKKMQAAMNKGISQAAAKLGGLPSISRDTQEAANNLFSEYYKSKGVEE